MVCLGNICRSPLAHGILRDKVGQHGLDITVDSAGTSGYHVGSAPDSRMCQTAKDNNVNIDDLKARQFEIQDFDRFDKIYVMDSSNYTNVNSLARNDIDSSKIELLLNVNHKGKNLQVPDPYYGGEQGFNDVYKLVNDATEVIIENYKTQ